MAARPGCPKWRMNSPVVSFCIPTYKRSRYLASLLESLVQQLRDFPYAYEIVIADNASPDDTGKVVREFAGQLPIRYLRHDSNIGCFPNVQFVMLQAAGRYVVYLSDDDCVLGEPLARAVGAMEAEPQIVVTYAPWLLYDLVEQRPQGQFYQVPQDLRVPHRAHALLLHHILKHHIFPEIHIARRDVMERLMPRINEHAFYAFVQAADYLSQGDVLIQREPFYVSITRYFADENRSQAGSEEVEYAWDRYRGGLEYMMACAGDSVSAEERAGFALRIQQMIAVRMSVAIRLRHAGLKDPVDTYTIAMRLRGMGYEALSPVPMPVLASQATMHFLLKDPLLNRGVEQLVCVGHFDPGAAGYLKRHATVPVRFVDGTLDAHKLHNTMLFVSEQQDDFELDDTLRATHNLQLVRERDLCARFGL
jgi:poly(ribitol-phosphate) beta-N-acetylglucosaminyltransferase